MIDTSTALTSEQVSTITRQTNYGTWRFQKTWKPLHIADAEGCWFTDGAGKRYLDFSSQLMCVNLGHKNPRVIEAIAEQARELAYVAPGFATTSRARLSSKLLEVLPKGHRKVLLYHQRHRGQRSGLQNRAHVHRQEQDHLALPLLSRIDRGLHRRHRRSAPLGHGAGRQNRQRGLRARDQLLRLPHQAHLPNVQHRLRRLHRAHDPQRERRRRHHR